MDQSLPSFLISCKELSASDCPRPKTPPPWPALMAARLFAARFRSNLRCYYAAVNTNDVVPMGWANLTGVLATFPPPGPSLYETDYYSLYVPIELLSRTIPAYAEIAPGNLDSFTATLVENESWTVEPGGMHSMQLPYFRMRRILWRHPCRASRKRGYRAHGSQRQPSCPTLPRPGAASVSPPGDRRSAR